MRHTKRLDTMRIVYVVVTACTLLFAFAALAQQSDATGVAQQKSALDALMSTGVVGAVCVMQSYMLNRMYTDARADRQADIVREDKKVTELVEVVKENTKAITLLEVRHAAYEASGENARSRG